MIELACNRSVSDRAQKAVPLLVLRGFAPRILRGVRESGPLRFGPLGTLLDTTHISQVISRSPAGCLVGPNLTSFRSRNGVFGWRLLRAFDRADFRSRL